MFNYDGDEHSLCDLCDDARRMGDEAGHSYYGEDDDYFYSDFADPGGRSALRAATPDNPRNLPCPTCREPNRLTRKDKIWGYQCDACADALERGGY